MGMRLAILLGTEEQDKGVVSIKDLRSGEQYAIARGEAAPALGRMLAGESPS